MKKSYGKNQFQAPKPRFQSRTNEIAARKQVRFNRFNIVATIIFGIIGAVLAFKANQLNKNMLALSIKQDSTSVNLKHFSRLLTKTDTVIGDLGEQLALLRIQQTISNKNAGLTTLSNEGRFFFAVRTLQSTLLSLNYYISNNMMQVDLFHRQDFLNSVDVILKGQLDNPFLISNNAMFRDWVRVGDTINSYNKNMMVAYAESKDEASVADAQNVVWMNCFFTILNLSTNTNDYMMYYRDANKRRKEYKPIKRDWK